MPMTLRSMTIALSLVVSGAATAAESLIPTPYPSGAVGAAPLNPGSPGIGDGQQIMQDPYPQATGSTSQGNPPTARGRRRGQRLVPSINQRKYDVDQAPR